MNKSDNCVLAFFPKDQMYFVVNDSKNKSNKGLSIGMFETNDGWCKGNKSFSDTQQQCVTKVSTLNGAERSENDASDVENIERLAARTLEKTTSKKSSKPSKYNLKH